MNKASSIKPLILIDGSSYLFRAFHALPPLTNTKGQPTGAVYGVLNMLRRLLKDYQPEYIGVIFDSKSKNFRHQLYPSYKANRTVMPNELQSQIEPLHTAIRALGLPLVVVEGVEADDVIATLADQAQTRGMKVLISTGDKDLAQLVNAQVTLINTMSQQILDEAGVAAKFGVHPNQIIDYLALTGDSVDNIPGIPGVGPKTAANWLKQYSTLDNIIQNADQISGKVGDNLRNNIPQVLLGRDLVKVKTDLPLPVTIEQLTQGTPDNVLLQQLFAELEFKSWLQELPQTDEALHSANYEIIVDESSWRKWLEKLAETPVFGLAIETNGSDSMQAELVGVSFSIGEAKAAYVPFDHLQRDWILQQLQPILTDPQKTWAGHHLKFDLKVLSRYGLTVKTILWDSLLAAYVLDSGNARYDLDLLAFKYLGYRAIPLEEVIGKGAKKINFSDAPIEKAGYYAAEKSDMSLRLFYQLSKRLADNPELQAVFNKIEMPLLPVLTKMEQDGVLIDAELLHRQSELLQKHITAIEHEVYGLSGEQFNLSSAKQLQVILFEKLKIPVVKKTPTGQPSTSEDVLQELSLNYPIPRLILIYRSYCKLKSTYTDRLPEDINPITGRVHTNYQQAVTSTGRLSSIDPNLQNIPIRSEEGRKIRQAFIAPPGHKILAADYSQVELRIMAHLSQDPGLLQAFSNSLDVHRSTAAEVYGITIDQVTADQRRNAKAINFGLMYGMSSFGLSQQLSISREEAQTHMNVYFSKYPRVREYMEKARILAAKQGYVKTLLGRRVQVADIKASNQFRRLAAERQAINAPLQGTAADIIKLAMIAIHGYKTTARMIMQVHDELVFEVPEGEIENLSNQIRWCMENVIELSVPLLVDIGIGNNWDEAH